MSGPPTVVIGTAGHIDHGKTSLLRALTGIDADRLPEERARGMTIDVGYAHLAFDDGVELDFVDIPGHDRLIGNMLVGAGEIDAAMLVVAADDGPRPQTIEHLQLLDALGISDGLAVVTKIDTVDAERVALVAEQVSALLAATSLARAPVLVASSITGEGIEAVRIALRGVSDRVVAGLQHESPMRLAIDRAFSAKGHGVVVTGTLRGSLSRGAWLRREPGGQLVRVRELQVHGAKRAFHGGGRAAFNITGDVARQLTRGEVLSGSASAIRATERVLVELLRPLEVGPNLTNVAPGSLLRLHIGTAQTDVKLRRIKADPGGVALAVLTLGEAIAAAPGDRGILREPASSSVVAGVRILDIAPPRGASQQRMTGERLASLLSAVLGRDATAFEQALLELHGAVPVDPATPPRHGFRSIALAVDVRASLVDATLEAVAAHHSATPLSPGLPLPRARALLARKLRSQATIEKQHTELATVAITRVIDDLVSSGRLARRGDALRDPAIARELSADLIAAMDRLEAALSVPAPPALDEAAVRAGCPPEGIRALTADGRIVRLGPDLAWATPTYHRLAAVALEHARATPLTPAAYRDATGTSRKFVMAILEDLDRRGILQRKPEGHVPGPRAPREAAS